MGYLELVEEAKRLPLHDRLRLMEELLRSFQRQVEPSPQSQRTVPSMSELRGILKPSEGPIPTDEEISEIIATHLLNKHG